MIDRKPLHEQIAEVLRDEIRSKYKPGDRLEPESRQAKRFGVSIVTVREAMLRLSQEGLIERRHGSGTYVLEPPKQMQRVAVLVSDHYLVTRPSYFFLRITQCIQQQLNERGIAVQIHLLPHPTPEGTESGLSAWLDRHYGDSDFDGAVAIYGGQPDLLIERIEKRGTPLVASGGGYPFSVSTSTHNMVRDGTEHLITAGRTRLALLQIGSPQTEAPRAGYFLRPFLEALEAADLPFRKEWVCGSVDFHQPGSGWEQFQALWQHGDEKPDGLLICDDTIYREASAAILALDIQVPEDLLVVTHYNRGSDLFFPFPTVRLENDPEEFAATVSEMLIRRMRGEPVPETHVTVPTRLKTADAE